MRLVQVAKILGMTGQELRHELLQVNFGVKPTDREVPDGLAKGIIRFVAQKKGLTIDLDTIGLKEEGVEAEGTEGTDGTEAAEEAAAPAAALPADVPAGMTTAKPTAVAPVDGLRVMRKLTLEGVPKEAIAREEQALKKLTKSER